jgi:hypothetical protein
MTTLNLEETTGSKQEELGTSNKRQESLPKLKRDERGTNAKGEVTNKKREEARIRLKIEETIDREELEAVKIEDDIESNNKKDKWMRNMKVEEMGNETTKGAPSLMEPSKIHIIENKARRKVSETGQTEASQKVSEIKIKIGSPSDVREAIDGTEQMKTITGHTQNRPDWELMVTEPEETVAGTDLRTTDLMAKAELVAKVEQMSIPSERVAVQQMEAVPYRFVRNFYFILFPFSYFLQWSFN